MCVCVLWLTFLCSISMSCILLRSTSVLSVYLYIPNVVYHPAFPIMPLCSCCSFQHSSLDIRVLFLKHRKGWDLVFYQIGSIWTWLGGRNMTNNTHMNRLQKRRTFFWQGSCLTVRQWVCSRWQLFSIVQDFADQAIEDGTHNQWNGALSDQQLVQLSFRQRQLDENSECI